MKFRWTFDYRALMATICAAVFTFCVLKYFEPVEAIQYELVGDLNIPSINLDTDVAKLSLVDGKLNTPQNIAGSYSKHTNKTLLIGHANSVFGNLKDVKIGDRIEYQSNTYIIYRSQISEKESISMKELLSKEEKDTIVLMTCCGQMYSDGDASHRLIIFASRA